MRGRVIGVVVALVLAAVGTVALVAFVRGAEDRALEGEELVPVLVVTDRVAAGTEADVMSSAVKEEQVPKKVVTAGAVGDLGSLQGLVASVDLVPGEQVTTARFVTPEVFSPSRGGVEVPAGLLEMTMALDASQTVGGVLKPGDTVAIVASISDPVSGEPVTHLILHKVLVTNVQGQAVPIATQPENTAAPRAGAPGGSLLITVATDAPSLERIVFVLQNGSIHLALEPADAPEDGTQRQTGETVLG